MTLNMHESQCFWVKKLLKSFLQSVPIKNNPPFYFVALCEEFQNQVTEIFSFIA